MAATPVLRASSAATTGASPLKNVKLRLNDSATPEKRMRVGKRSATIAMTVPAQIGADDADEREQRVQIHALRLGGAKNGHDKTISSVVPVNASALRDTRSLSQATNSKPNGHDDRARRSALRSP